MSVQNAKKEGVRARFAPTGVVFPTSRTEIEQTRGFEVFCACNRNLLRVYGLTFHPPAECFLVGAPDGHGGFPDFHFLRVVGAEVLQVDDK